MRFFVGTVLAGLGLKSEEFSKAFQRLPFNVFVQLYNFGIDSSVVYGVAKGLLALGWLSEPLADGMVVCASLSMTINMVLVLTKSSGGEEASAIFNAAAGNMIGVVLTPLLVLGYLGVSGNVDLGDVFYKLALRVVLPIVVGQILRQLSPATVEFYKTHKHTFKQLQQFALVFIVYTVFCRTFSQQNNAYITGVDIVVMIVVEFVCLSGLMVLAWVSLRFFFRDEPKLRVMGLFGCTHKTVAMGVPLINAIYENNAWIGLITLPLLIWHTMQLIIGSFLAPRLAAWVEKEEERLGKASVDNEDDEIGRTGRMSITNHSDQQLVSRNSFYNNQGDKDQDVGEAVDLQEEIDVEKGSSGK
jgi:sodium/bile acid cotransporter 7